MKWEIFIKKNYSFILLLLFNVVIILLFAGLYYLCHSYCKKSFYIDNSNSNSNSNSNITFVDHFLMSLSLQFGIGVSDIYPYTYNAKLIVSVQEFIILVIGLFSIFLFIFQRKNV